MFEISYNIQKVNEYLILDKEMKDAMENKSPTEKNLIWNGKYKKTQKGNIEKLPDILALLHPRYYFNSGGKKIDGNLIPKYTNTNFGQDIRPLDPCQIHKLIGVECPFNKDPRKRGKCHGDHHWPFSLGGTNNLTNRVLLCSYHNQVKSSGIYFFNWKEYPKWLDDRLAQMYNLKS